MERLRVSQRKILTQLQLKKNHRGTFCADIQVDDQNLIAYLSDKVIEDGKLYTDPIEGSHYWASINISKTSAFINQLLPLSQYNKRSSELEYYCYCQRLEDGRIQLIQEQGDDYIVLPKRSVYSKLYRIFYNSLVVVTFSHNADYKKGGFVLQQWQTKEPEYVSKGVVTNIHKKTDDPTTYLADYYVDEKIFLPVIIPKFLIQQLGIHSVTEQAILPASIIFDDKGCKAKTSLPVNPERLLALHKP